MSSVSRQLTRYFPGPRAKAAEAVSSPLNPLGTTSDVSMRSASLAGVPGVPPMGSTIISKFEVTLRSQNCLLLIPK